MATMMDADVGLEICEGTRRRRHLDLRRHDHLGLKRAEGQLQHAGRSVGDVLVHPAKVI